MLYVYDFANYLFQTHEKQLVKLIIYPKNNNNNNNKRKKRKVTKTIKICTR